jgi:uncharacterized protein YggE
MKILRALAVLVLFAPFLTRAQQTEVKFIADTLVVQAEGSYETDPDLAVMTFDISSQEKELKDAYTKASESIRTIVSVAEKNGLAKEAIQTGVLSVIPFYDNDRKRRAKAYRVQGHVVLRIADFSKVGPIMDDSVQDGIVDFRSLTYELSNVEAAKQKAVADAMHRAVGRASIALEQTKQKLGAARSVSLEVHNLVGIAQIQSLSYNAYNYESDADAQSSGGVFRKEKRMLAPPPPPPPVQPGKISISASVQCVFGIER